MMGRIRRQTFLQSDLATAEALYASMPTEGRKHALDRIGLESRVEELREELQALEDQPATSAEAILYFYGAPVKEDHGIEARFSGDVLRAYQDLLTKTVAVQKGKLASKGPVPSQADSQLHITDVAHGSFGFQLEELPNSDVQQSLFPTPLAEAIETASSLISAAAESDESFAERVAGTNERVYDALKSFLAVVQKNDAQFRVVSHGGEVALDAGAIARANDRASAEWSEAADQPIRGTFGGATVSGRFDHVTESGEIIRGKVAEDLDTREISVAWHGQPCVAHMRVVTLTRGTKQHKSYTLLSITPPTE